MSADGASEMEVRGRVGGERGIVERAVQSVAFLPDPFGLRDAVPGMWARLVLTTPIGQAGLRFGGASWWNDRNELRVDRMDPDPVHWLRTFLADAGRTLDAYGSHIPTADVAWAITRLRLIFVQVEGATEAVQRGLDILRRTGATEVDTDDLRLLHRQLRICSCPDAAVRLGAYLDGMRE